MAAALGLVGGLGSSSCTSGMSGTRAGDFSVQGVDGAIYHLSEYRGYLVMVLFFASYDQRSRALMVQLTELRDRYVDRGLVILCIAVDGPGSVAQVRQIARTRNVDLPIAIDADTSISAHYNPKRIVPYGVFFGRNGKVVDRWLGHERNEVAALEKRIQSLLD